MERKTITLEILLNEHPEVKKMVYEQIPITKKERQRCSSELMKKAYERWELANKLIHNGHTPKQEYLPG